MARKHGTRGRYGDGCRCLACCRRGTKKDRPSDLRWPIRFVLKRHDPELVQDLIYRRLTDPQTIEYYKEYGITDVDADKLACSLGDHPMLVWPGWIEAGLDDE